MRDVKTTPSEVWGEYEKAVSYNYNINLYDTVEMCENFYNGRQWEGVKADDLEKPVFNIIKRVINLFIANIVSDDISISVTPFNTADSAETEQLFRALKTEIERVIENTKFKTKNRQLLRNAAVDGDGAYHFYFNADAESGQMVKGIINCELIDNTNLFFGNPYSSDIQSQPYLLILQRRTVDSVRNEAISCGMSEDEANLIIADNPGNLTNEETASELVSVIIKYWRDEKGKIHCVKVTPTATIREEWNTGYNFYPVSYMSWENVKNSYHGQSVVLERIPNQIFINKIFAMAMYNIKLVGFPKIVYDMNRLPNGFTNRIGEAIAVEGNVNEALATAIQFPDMSNKVMEIAEKTMQYTQEYMGASDATLGNMRPENATAIVALQSSSNAPLELVKQNFYQCVEDSIRIITDLISCHYGRRTIYTGSSTAMLEGKDNVVTVDFDDMKVYSSHINVDVGASSYWSEIMQVQTLDAMLANGIIVNPIDYLNSLPEKYVRNKQTLIDSLRSAQSQGAQGATGGAAVPTEEPYDTNLTDALAEQGLSDNVIERANING